MHSLVGEYDIIFYLSNWFSGDDDEENISRTAVGNVVMKLEEIEQEGGQQQVLTGKYEITSTGSLGKHLTGVFAENTVEDRFDFFMPLNVPTGKTVLDGLKEWSNMEDESEEADDFMDSWQMRRQVLLKRLTKQVSASLQADKLPGIEYQPEDLSTVITPSPPEKFVLEPGTLMLEFEEYSPWDPEEGAETESIKRIYLCKRSKDN